MITPKAVHKAISYKILTKQPSSVPTSHIVVTLSLYIFDIFVLSDCYICHIHVILSQDYHFKFPLK